MDKEKKSSFIQWWRGIAVLLVVYYHFSNRVPPEYLGMANAPTIVFYSGKLGVLIFFIISGYLIARSLTTSSNLGLFYSKRISRIWPLFILASITIFLFLQFVEPPVVPAGPKKFYAHERDWTDLLGSIFFLEDFGFRWMDGVFWSILVELKFYFWIGLLAYCRPGTFVRDFAAVAVILTTAELILNNVLDGDTLWISRALNGIFIAQYLSFFAIGALLTKPGHNRLFGALIILALSQSVLKITDNPEFEWSGTFLFLAIFAALLLLDGWLLRARAIRHVGNYSYGFYLFHQMIGLSIIKMMGGFVNHDIAILIALLLTYILSVAASRVAEWRFRETFISMLMWLFGWLGFNRLRLNLPQKEVAR